MSEEAQDEFENDAPEEMKEYWELEREFRNE